MTSHGIERKIHGATGGNKEKIMRKCIVCTVVLIFSLSCLIGCASIEDDRKRTQAEGTAVGAGAGAALGALIGALTGGGRGAVAGAAIGAAAGGVAGYAYGTHVANEKQKYANEEDWLNACVASARDVNQQTYAYNNKLSGEIELLENETAGLENAYRQKQVHKSALDQEKHKVDAKLKEAQDKLARAKFELDNQEKVLAEAKASGSGQYAEQLQTEINSLKAYIAELEGHTDSLASMSSRMAV